VDAWLTNPLRAWLALAVSRSGVDEQSLLTNFANDLDVDQRTIDRWLSGEPIGKLSWPYAPKVAATLGKKGSEPDVQLLTGWLLIACAFQSMLPEIRGAVRRDLVLRKQQPWALESAIAKMNQEGERLGNSPVRSESVPLLNEIQQCFSARPRNDDVLRLRLGQFHKLIEQATPALRPSYRYIHDWFSARHAALLGEKESALQLYASAVSAGWWRAGGNQQPILNEALLYAVGVGDKDAANAYWDKTFMLGLNRGPKRPLDDQEMRRIAFAFEQMFSPQKAKDRIPPPMELRTTEDAFTLGRKHLANPNQKTKYPSRYSALAEKYRGTGVGLTFTSIRRPKHPHLLAPDVGPGTAHHLLQHGVGRTYQSFHNPWGQQSQPQYPTHLRYIHALGFSDLGYPFHLCPPFSIILRNVGLHFFQPTS